MKNSSSKSAKNLLKVSAQSPTCNCFDIFRRDSRNKNIKISLKSGLAFFVYSLYNEGKVHETTHHFFGNVFKMLRLFLENLRFPEEPIIYEYPALWYPPRARPAGILPAAVHQQEPVWRRLEQYHPHPLLHGAVLLPQRRRSVLFKRSALSGQTGWYDYRQSAGRASLLHNSRYLYNKA